MIAKIKMGGELRLVFAAKHSGNAARQSAKHQVAGINDIPALRHFLLLWNVRFHCFLSLQK
jgi:hypothetical protein